MNTVEHESSQSGGNTKLHSLRYRRWCFTLNNYSEENINTLITLFQSKNWLYIFGKEVGENGTPHLQGYLESKNAIAFTTLKKINECIHWEQARGNKEENIKYCSKEGDVFTNIKTKEPIRDPLSDKKLRDFQIEILEIVSKEPDERTVYWFWDADGNSGKTALSKHLCLTFPNEVLFLGGKGSDIKYGVYSFLENKENDLKICIFHFTRSVENYVSYESIESIKDGIFYNTKYESGMCLFNTPHVICFANFEPDTEKLSLDRWRIQEISATPPEIDSNFMK